MDDKKTSITKEPVYGYMRQKEVLKLLPFSAATLWRMVKAGTFVKPTKLAPRVTGFEREAVYAWMQERRTAK